MIIKVVGFKKKVTKAVVKRQSLHCQNWVVGQIHFVNPGFKVGNVIRISFTRCDHKTIKVVFYVPKWGLKAISNSGDSPKIVLIGGHTPE